MIVKRLAALALFVATIGAVAFAANVPLITGPVDPANQIATINGVIQSINSNIATGAGVTIFKNFLDNSDFGIAQRGVGSSNASTCGTTTIPETAYNADRWGCNVNVTSGAGTLQTVTSSPSPPPGSINSLVLYRTSGALGQSQCAIQEIPSNKATMLAGQTVVLSTYLEALSGLSADNGNLANLHIFTGTGQNQGLQSFTASPAITPAWSGIVDLATGSANVTLSATQFNRFNTALYPVPLTVTEMAVAICFTPGTATSGGSTDGIAIADVQLEPIGPNGTGPTSYAHLDPAIEAYLAGQYYQRIAEPVSGAVVGADGFMASTTSCRLDVGLGNGMFKTPTFAARGTALSASTWQIVSGASTSVLASTFIVQGATNTTLAGGLTATTVAGGGATGSACTLIGAGGGSALEWGADF